MTINVTQLNNYIKSVFDIDGVLNDVSVCGEVTNLKRAANGWYFSLKDEFSAINCFCYFGAVEPRQGVVAVAEGQINFYAKNGTVSCFVRKLTATDSLGTAYARFVELRDRLGKEGLFDEARKNEVPHCCMKVGVVTSETGAVIHDIENVVLRRQPFTEIILYPVKVQGEGAEFSIAQGILYFNETDVDAVIVGRGGGSNEDLSVFNSEIIVRAIASCLKPVVSAVGHGVDYTLSDFAADKRAVTPSEAAEFVTIDAAESKDSIAYKLASSFAAVSDKIRKSYDKILTDVKLLQSTLSYRIENIQKRISNALFVSNAKVSEVYSNYYVNTQNKIQQLSVLNPTNVLKRGYAMVYNADGSSVTALNKVNIEDIVTVTLQDGKFTAKVTDKEQK